MERCVPDRTNPEAVIESKFATRNLKIQQNLDDVAEIMGNNRWDDSPTPHDLDMSGLTSYPQQMSIAFGCLQGMEGFGASLDPMYPESKRT